MDAIATIVLFFAAGLLSVLLVRNMDRAAVEEAALKYGMRIRRDLCLKMRFAATFVRVGLRLRMCVLPFVTAAVGVTVVLRGSLQSNDLIIGVLALGFISEADHVLSSLLLTPPAHQLTEPLIAGLKRGKEASQVPWFRNRCRGVLCALALAIGVLYIENLMAWLGDEQGRNGRLPCSDVINTASEGIWISLTFVLNVLFASGTLARELCTTGASDPHVALRRAGREISLNLVALGLTYAVALAIVVCHGERHVLKTDVQRIIALVLFASALCVGIGLVLRRWYVVLIKVG